MTPTDDHPRKSRTGQQKRSVVIVDDDARVRRALRTLIDSSPDLRVVGEAATSTETLDVVTVENPDVVIVDMLLPDASDGLALTRTLSNSGKVIVAISMLASLRQDALAAGAMGFFEKGGDGMTRLHEMLRTIGL